MIKRVEIGASHELTPKQVAAIKQAEKRARDIANHPEAIGIIVRLTRDGVTDREMAKEVQQFGLALDEGDIRVGRNRDILPTKAPELIRRNNLAQLARLNQSDEGKASRQRAVQIAAENAQPRVYTPEVSQRIIKLMANHLTYQQISVELAKDGLDVSAKSLKQQASRRGWRSTSDQNPEKVALRQEAARLYQQGLTPTQIATELGLSVQDVCYRLKDVDKRFRVDWDTEVDNGQGNRVTLADIAQRLGAHSVEEVRRVAKDAGITVPITDNSIRCLLQRRRKKT